MQRHLKPSGGIDTNIDTTPTLSVEELAIQADEHSEAQIAVDQSADDLDRVTDIADVSTDTMLIVSDKPELGTVEQGLIDAVADMAVAGTDANGADVISATPVEGALTTEGIVSTLKSIWDSIVAAIKNLWVGFKHWATTYFSTMEQNKRHAAELIKRLEGMKGYLGEGDVKVIDIFNYGGSMGLNALFGGIERDEKRLREYIVDVVDKQSDAMLRMGPRLAEVYAKFDGSDINQISDLANQVAANFEDYLKHLGLTEGKDGLRTSKKIGNMTVTCKGFSQNAVSAESSPETKLALMSRVRFSVDQGTDFGATQAILYKVDVTPEALMAKVKDTAAFIDEMLKFKNEFLTKLEEQASKVEEACSKMLGNIKEDNKLGQTAAKRIMPLASAYSNWATQPGAKLLSVGARHNKFWLVLAEQTMNHFKPQAGKA